MIKKDVTNNLNNHWQHLNCEQLPQYQNKKHLIDNINKLSLLPKLVKVKQIESLKKYIYKSQQGKTFILQAGDCAESFSDCEPQVVKKKFYFYNTVLTY